MFTLRRILLFLGLLLVGLALTGWWAINWTPTFYPPAVANRSDKEEVRKHSKTLVQKAMQLADEMRNESSFEAEFTEEQINAWLADELPRKYGKLLPAGFSEPRAHFEPGVFEIACRVETSYISFVASSLVRTSVTEDNLLALEVDTLRAGRIPLPTADLLEPLVKGLRLEKRRIEWRQIDGREVLVVDLLGNREDDKRRSIGVRKLEKVELDSGVLRLQGKTTRRSKT